MVIRSATRFDQKNWFKTEIDKSAQSCEVIGELDGVPVSFFGHIEEDLIIGGAVVWNQLNIPSNNRTRTTAGITFTNNNDGSVSVNGTCLATDAYSVTNAISATPNHKYYVCGVESTQDYSITNGNRAISPIGVNGAVVAISGSAVSINLYVVSGATLDIEIYPQIFDLTQMFGSTVADYIYSLEQATAGAGVALFKALFPADYYEYNAGEEKTITLR